MKQCHKCNQTKPLNEFNKNSSRRDGLQSRCRSCDTEIGKQYYRKNKDKFQARNKKYKSRGRQWVWDYLSKHPCVDCGFSNPRGLTFDHINPTDKRTDLSKLTGYSLKALQEEVDKCEVRCGTCHLIKTSYQFNWYRDIKAT